MQKRSNRKTEGIVKYVVNGDRLTQPFGYCECHYNSPPSSSTANREEVSSVRYKRSLMTRSRSKRQLNSNLFVPNLDDQFDIFHSFGSPGRSSNNRDLHLNDPPHIPNDDRHSQDIDFEPIYLDQDSMPYHNHHTHLPEMPKRQPPPKQIPDNKQISVHHHDQTSHNLKSSKRLKYSEREYVVKPKHDTHKPLPDSPPKYHVKSTTPQRDEPHPRKDSNNCDVSKLLSRIQADYFICCDECRQRILKKFSNEGCKECAKSLEPTDKKEIPCKTHTEEVVAQKCGCDHNKNILENLKKISQKLSELAEGRSETVPKKKEAQNSNAVKKRLLQQLNNIYEKLKCLKSKDDIKPKKRKECKSSKCKCSKRLTSKNWH